MASTGEDLRRRHMRDIVSHIPSHLRRLDWSAQQLQNERDRRLQILVRHAKAHSPWHSGRLSDIDPNSMSEASIERLPVMTKNDVMNNFDGIVTDPQLTLDVVEKYLEHDVSMNEAETRHQKTITGAREALSQVDYSDGFIFNRFRVKLTSGSSGRRGIFVSDWDAWITWYLSICRRGLRHDLRSRRDTPIKVAAFGSTLASWNFSTPRMEMHRVPLTFPMAAIVEWLGQMQPDVLVGFPSVLRLLTTEAAAGELRIAPRRITCVSEPLFPAIRAALESTWDAWIENVWATSESGAMAVSCDQGPSMHLSDDLLIIEPVDGEGRPVPPGKRASKVYITNLYNMLQPLIRYEITDEVIVRDDRCKCGSGHRVVSDVQGRQEDTFRYEGNIFAHPFVFSGPLDANRFILEYQVRQTRRGADIALRCSGPVDLDGMGHAIAQRLTALGLVHPQVRLTLVPSLMREDSSKLKRFVSL
jgi:phenylacetate-coenzyme A ligase PaaK-like adenylate-forming protein